MSLTTTITETEANNCIKPRTNTGNNQKYVDTKIKYLPQQKYTPTTLSILRILCICGIFMIYQNSHIFQGWIDTSWEYIHDKWWFQTVYFETLLVVVYSFPSTLFFMIIDKIPYFDKYRVEPKGGRIISESIPDIIAHAAEYILPLATIDTFHVKHYYGVTDDVITKKKKNWIQTTRAFPDYAPRFYDVIMHIFIAIVIYDAIFFFAHYNIHKNQTLYKTFHKLHHTHDVINAKTTDHQNWIERIFFIILANAGLKVQGAHPFTRLIFVFVFVNILLYNHGGYDFPWAYDKLVPWNLMGGSKQHYIHHASGKRNYQFCFTYLDNALERWKGKKNKRE